MKLVCMFTQSSTPNQIRSMPSFAATGASSGMTMKAISKKSRKKARKKTKMLTKTRKPSWPPGRPVSMCSIQRPPSMPWNTSEKQVEPTRMNTTMAVMRMVDCIPCRTSGQVSRRCSAASTIAPTAPMAPASVGVARPMKIVPSTRKISTTEGIMPHRTRLISFQPISPRASGGSGGMAFGRTIESPTTVFHVKHFFLHGPSTPDDDAEKTRR